MLAPTQGCEARPGRARLTSTARLNSARNCGSSRQGNTCRAYDSCGTTNRGRLNVFSVSHFSTKMQSQKLGRTNGSQHAAVEHGIIPAAGGLEAAHFELSGDEVGGLRAIGEAPRPVKPVLVRAQRRCVWWHNAPSAPKPGDAEPARPQCFPSSAPSNAGWGLPHRSTQLAGGARQGPSQNIVVWIGLYAHQ